MFDLSIIIVNWNTKDLLRKCLHSIYDKTNGIKYEIIVIDNASKDGSARMVREEFPEVKLIENKENVGFAKGNNQGFLRAEGRYILLLNPDTELVDNSFLKMVNYMRLNKEAGAVAPKFLYPDGTFQRYYARFPTFLSMVTRWFLPRRLAFKLKPTRLYLMLDDDFSKIREIEQPAGACIMTRKSLFLNENLMDLKFPVFFNDVDLCRRIYKKGLKIFILPEACIVHYKAKGGSEQGKKSLYLSAEFFLSMVDYFFKYEGVLKASLLKILISLGFVVRSMKILIESLLGIKKKEDLKYEMRRLYIFLRKKYIFSRN